MLEKVYQKVKDTNIVYANDKDIRFTSTAGGYITSLIKFLFEDNYISTSYIFERKGIKFYPKLIYTFEDYKNVGSLYQEINILKFLKINKDNIKGRLLVTCLPCEVNSIRHFAKKNGIDVFIISLVCSGQMSLSCTETHLSYLNIKEKDILDFRYRGMGWPKYLHIKKTDNSIIEEKALWNHLFHSYLFHEKRCLKCTDTFGVNSDFSVSDPWLGKKMKDEKIGKSIVFSMSEESLKINRKIKESNYFSFEKIEKVEAINRQLNTIKKKFLIRTSNKFKLFFKLIRNKYYKKIILSNKIFLIFHSKVINRIIHKLIKEIK